MKIIKKRASLILSVMLPVIILLLINLSSINLTKAQQTPPMPDIPIVKNIANTSTESGLPESFEKFQQAAEQLSEEESRKAYLKQEWTKLFAKNKFFAPLFYYTDKFFSFFNPIWKLIFGMEFSWSWEFFLSIFIWISLIIIFYFPLKAFFKSSLFGLIGGIITASLVGLTKVITKTVEILETAVTDLLKLTIVVVLLIIVLVLYSNVMKSFEKESEEEKLKRAKQNIKAHGEVSGKALDELSK